MSQCDICSRLFKNERGLRIHLRIHRNKQQEEYKGNNMLPSLPEFVVLGNLLPFLDVNSISSLLVTCKCMFKVCVAQYNNCWWRRALRTYGLYRSSRLLPECNDQPGIAFLRLSEVTTKKGRCCFSCRAPTSSINRFYMIPLCRTCQQNKDQYQCVTRTTAMREYCLKGKEVDDLEYTSVKNPYYRSAAPMKLYLLSDVIRVQGSRDIETIQLKKEEAREKRKKTISDKQEARKKELVGALDKVGLELRYDSELCERYIKGSSSAWSLDAVVKEMAFMKYLHEYTDYSTRLEEEVEQIAKYDGYYSGIWREAADYTKQRYTRPDVWPWLAS